MFADSQVRFFEYIGGCFREGAYNNMRNVVSNFVGRIEKGTQPRAAAASGLLGSGLLPPCRTTCGWSRWAIWSSARPTMPRIRLLT